MFVLPVQLSNLRGLLMTFLTIEAELIIKNNFTLIAFHNQAVSFLTFCFIHTTLKSLKNASKTIDNGKNL